MDICYKGEKSPVFDIQAGDFLFSHGRYYLVVDSMEIFKKHEERTFYLIGLNGTCYHGDAKTKKEISELITKEKFTYFPKSDFKLEMMKKL